MITTIFNQSNHSQAQSLLKPALWPQLLRSQVKLQRNRILSRSLRLLLPRQHQNLRRREKRRKRRMSKHKSQTKRLKLLARMNVRSLELESMFLTKRLSTKSSKKLTGSNMLKISLIKTQTNYMRDSHPTFSKVVISLGTAAPLSFLPLQ